MRLFAIASMIVLGLAACGESVDEGQIRADAREGMVDECYQEQAEAYEDAAVFLQEAAQDHLPPMVNATLQLFNGALDQELSTMKQGHSQFMDESDSLLLAGDDFAAKMERADALCD